VEKSEDTDADGQLKSVK